MTYAATLDQFVIRELLQSIVEREVGARPSSTGWLPYVAEKIASLPWSEANLPDRRTTPQLKPAVGLMILLGKVLNSDTVPPSSVSVSWAGGVGVEWYTRSMDLEIYCEPDGNAEFGFKDRSIDSTPTIKGTLRTPRPFASQCHRAKVRELKAGLQRLLQRS